jgi:hypothetical protein
LLFGERHGTELAPRRRSRFCFGEAFGLVLFHQLLDVQIDFAFQLSVGAGPAEQRAEAVREDTEESHRLSPGVRCSG